MTHRSADVFRRFLRHSFSRSTREGALELIESEPYHDEHVPAVQSFTPWLAGAALLLVIAYAPPIAQTMRSQFPGGATVTRRTVHGRLAPRPIHETCSELDRYLFIVLIFDRSLRPERSKTCLAATRSSGCTDQLDR